MDGVERADRSVPFFCADIILWAVVSNAKGKEKEQDRGMKISSMINMVCNIDRQWIVAIPASQINHVQ